LFEISDHYEESYQLFEASKPDPDKEKHQVDSKPGAALVAHEEEPKKQENIVVKERLFNKTWAIYSTHKNETAEMVKHADGLESASMVESENIKGLPAFEAKEDLVNSLEAVTIAAE
jgi:hypothetical protein